MEFCRLKNKQIFNKMIRYIGSRLDGRRSEGLTTAKPNPVLIRRVRDYLFRDAFQTSGVGSIPVLFITEVRNNV